MQRWTGNFRFECMAIMCLNYSRAFFPGKCYVFGFSHDLLPWLWHDCVKMLKHLSLHTLSWNESSSSSACCEERSLFHDIFSKVIRTLLFGALTMLDSVIVPSLVARYAARAQTIQRTPVLVECWCALWYLAHAAYFGLWPTGLWHIVPHLVAWLAARA